MLVIHDDDRKLMNRFHDDHPGIFLDFVNDIFSEVLLKEKCLRNRKCIYSIHSNIHEKKRKILN